MKRVLATVMGCVFLGGCALPLPVTVVSWAADIFSVITTKKTVLDHGVSIAAQQDCALHRAITTDSRSICQPLEDDTLTLIADAGTPVPLAADGAKPSVSLVEADPGASGKQLNTSFETASRPEPRMALASFSYDTVMGDEIDGTGFSTPRGSIRDIGVVFKETGDDAADISGGWVDVTSKGAESREALNTVAVRIDMDRFVRLPKRTSVQAPDIQPVGLGEIEIARIVGPVVMRQPSELDKVPEPDGPVQIVKPHAGVYVVIGSFHALDRAQIRMKDHMLLRPKVLKAIDNRTEKDIYRVVVGPFALTDKKEVYRRIARAGIRHSWAIRIVPGHWHVAARTDQPPDTPIASLHARDWPGLGRLFNPQLADTNW